MSNHFLNIFEQEELKEKKVDRSKNNILIVEDNIPLLSCLKTSLEETYNIFIAMNGKIALERLDSIPKPDLIISDVVMDEMDGYAFFNALSKKTDYKDIPFVFLTAKTNYDDKIKGLSDGAIDYMYKPFSIEELQAKVKSIIQNLNLKQALYEKDKFATLGMLLGGICHEISNPLSLIYGPLDLLEMELDKVELDNKENIHLYLDRIAGNVKRIEKIINSIKLFSYQNALKKEKVNLHRIIESITEIFNNKIKDRINILDKIDKTIEILGDESAVSHILMNLISNAIDAITDKGEITIRTEETNDSKVIRVIDNGTGIPESKLPHIYNAFYTCKDIGKGTGLGLYIVKELVSKLDWNIEVKTKEGEGTEFRIII